jgi:asparagine synthase (glutamine-hydrolysing)
LFGGYRRYQHYAKALQAKQFGLGGAVRVIADLAHRHTHDPRYARFAATLDGGYATLFCGAYFQQPEAVAFINQQLKSKLDPIAAAMDFDLRSYLPDDLNVKMDRASMAHGLEARSPFLDQELVSYATQLPTEYRFQAGKTKPLLVEAVKDLLSSDITRRPKRGFQVPLASWFRGPLRPAFVERCLESARVHQYVSKTQIEQLLSENDRGSDHGNRLWMLYSLATWLKRYE